MTCTQEELLQVLSKLMQERQKVKALELQIARGTPPVAPSPVSSQQLEEIADLKEIIQRQTAQLEQALKPKPAVVVESPALQTHLQEIDALKKELKLKERQHADELKNLRDEFAKRPTPKEIPDFSFELETTERALKEARQKITELERSVEQAKKDAPAFLEEELENSRLQIREGLTERRELERKLTVALQEKQTSHQAQENISKELSRLKQQYELVVRNERSSEELSEELMQLRPLFADAKREVVALQQQIALLTPFEEEAHKQKAHIVRLEKETESQKGEIALLEEHLTRRIKECGDKTAGLEEREAELQKKERKIERLESEFSELQQKTTEELSSFKTSLATAEEELFHARDLLEEQEAELYELRKMAERFQELEELFSHSYKLFTKRAEPKSTPKPKSAPKSLAPSDLFLRETQARRYDLFE